MTGMYNVLERVREFGADSLVLMPLDGKEKKIYEQGLVGILKQLHDELDAAVGEAYGWSDLYAKRHSGGRVIEDHLSRPSGVSPKPTGQTVDPESHKAEILTRLVALNAERAAEEARGQVRWLRPEFQNRAAATAPGSDTDPVGRVSTRQPTLDIAHDDATTGGDGGLKPALRRDAGDGEDLVPAPRSATKTARLPWPKTLPEQHFGW